VKGEPARWEGEALLLALHVQPRARRDEVCGPHGDRIKVRITAPPLEGRANQHLLRYLAALFGVPGSRVELLNGERGREKRVRILRPETLPEWVPAPPASSHPHNRR